MAWCLIGLYVPVHDVVS